MSWKTIKSELMVFIEERTKKHKVIKFAFQISTPKKSSLDAML